MAVDELSYENLHRPLQHRAGEDRPAARIAIFTFSARTTATLSPARGYTPSPEVSIDTYLKMAETLGIERIVIANPTPYGTRHQCTIDSLEIFGRNRAQRIAVVNESFQPGSA